MVWLALALLILAFRRGWVLAPMLLFALPFAAPALAVSLEYRGLDPGLLVPDAIAGFTVEMVSLAGLAVLALHKRRL